MAFTIIGVFLTGVGMLTLRVLGGVGNDTGLAVMVAAFAVTDFWAGVVLTVLTRASAQVVVVTWTAARAALLAVLALVVGYTLLLAVAQVAVAAGAAAVGARIAAPGRGHILEVLGARRTRSRAPLA